MPQGLNLPAAQASASVTVAELAARYMAEHAPRKKAASVRQDELTWRRHILPTLGPVPVREVTRAHIMTLHADLGKAVSHVTANRARALISKALTLAEVWELRPDGSNPCRHVPKFHEDGRERMLSPDELARLGVALNAARSWRAWQIVPLVRLLLLTGCRLREIMAARLEWVDFSRSALLLPDSKTGARFKPLSEPALEIIRQIPRNGSPWLIPGRIPGQCFVEPYGAWRRLCAMADLKGVHLHDLRHTAGSVAHAAGLSQREVADFLGHKQLATTEKYIHSDGSRKHDNENTVANEMKKRMGIE